MEINCSQNKSSIFLYEQIHNDKGLTLHSGKCDFDMYQIQVRLGHVLFGARLHQSVSCL